MRFAATFLLGFLTLPLVGAIDPPKEAEPYELRRTQALQLVQKHSPQSIQRLETLLQEQPGDALVLFYLGLESGDRGRQLKPGPQRREWLIKSRDYFVKARAAGSDQPLIATALAEINADGSENVARLASDPKLQQVLAQAEEAFGRHDFAAAQAGYRAALKIDPTNYAATLYLGDTFFAAGQYADGLQWFTKATKLDPNQEKAYRYAGDCLIRLSRKEEAIEQYLQAVVAEPYNQYSWTGLKSGCGALMLKPWVSAAKAPVADVKPEPKKENIVLPENFTTFQVAYSFARAKWQAENCARLFPASQTYRQTLEEEVYALDAVIKIFRELSAASPRTPDVTHALAEVGSSLDELVAIQQQGLLEAHVLFFRANADLARDYPAYRDKNREKLQRYLVQYYLHLSQLPRPI